MVTKRTKPSQWPGTPARGQREQHSVTDAPERNVRGTCTWMPACEAPVSLRPSAISGRALCPKHIAEEIANENNPLFEESTSKESTVTEQTTTNIHWSASRAWRATIRDMRAMYPHFAGMNSGEFESWLHEIFGGVNSLKDLDQNWNTDNATDYIQEQMQAVAGPADMASAPLAMATTHTESPVVVYPMERGGVVYAGVRFSVTMRAGGSWAMALPLLNDFVANKQYIDPSCLVRNVQEQPAPRQPQSVSSTRDEAPARGGEYSEGVVIAKREYNSVKDYPFVGLYTLFGTDPGKFATYQIKLSNTAMLERLQVLTGIPWETQTVGFKRDVQLTATYQNSTNLDKNGKPYKNLVALD